MDKIKKIDDLVMKILGVETIKRLICITGKGQLELVIRKGENNYFLSIDSVPLGKETNDKLMEILFKPDQDSIKRLEKIQEGTEVIKTMLTPKKSYYKPKSKQKEI